MQKKKPVGIWIGLLVAPLPAMIVMAFVQALVRAAAGGNADGITIFVNILSLLVGIAAVLCLLLIPLWIVMLVRATSYNSKLGTSHIHPPQPPLQQ